MACPAKKFLKFVLLVALPLIVLMAPGLVSAADIWTLSFDIKANWYAHMERLDIYVDNTKVKQLSASDFSTDTLNGNAPVSPKHIDVDISAYAALNSQVKLRLYKIASAGNPWILLDNVSVLRNGKYVRYTNWTINKNPAAAGLTLKQIYGDEQRLVFVHNSFDGPVSNGNYAEFVSAPLADSAELEVKPSDIAFTPETPILTTPQAVTINATVRNTGSADTGNTAKMELWINGAKQSETPLFSVLSGGAAIKSFSYNYGGALDKVEIRVSSTDDARVYNNTAVRYLTPAKPYLLFKNFSETPIEKYKTIAPYNTMRTQILNYAASYKSNPGILGYKIENIAAAYLLKNDASYADVATNALLNIGQCKGTSFAEHPYVDCEDDVSSYVDSFDMLREYIFKNRNADYYTIQQTLAEIVSDAKWRGFNYYAFDFIEAFPRKAMIGDINNFPTAENSLIISSASGLLDYHGNKMDELDASRTAEIAAKNMLEESYLGAPLPAARLITGEGGYGMEGGYKAQYLGWISKAMAVYGSIYENPLNKYPLARGILDMPAWHTLPIGCEPPEKGQSSGQSSWGDDYLLLNLFQGQDKINHQWYIDNVLKKSYCSQASSPSAVDRGFMYNNQYISPAKPSWGPTDSYFSESNAMAILRNGYAPDYNATYLRLVGHKDGVWGNAETSHSYQGSYTMWSKNAYLVSERADERDFTVFAPNDGGFGYSSFIFNDNSTFSILDQFGSQSNPAILESYIASSNIDAARMKTTINKLKNVVLNQSNTASQIRWNRDVLFPSKEYYLISDRLSADSSYNFDMVVHYGGTEPDTTLAKYDNHYPVSGTLTIGGENINWAGDQIVAKPANGVKWNTKSMLTPIAVPLPQHNVELTTFIAPLTSITNFKTAQQFGSYAKPSGFMWRPAIRSRQSGTTVKYLTVQYPRDVTAGEVEPSIQQVAVAGGSGDDYAIKLLRGTVKDIAGTGDGELITADSMKTDAEIAFSRFDGSLKYFMMENGAKFSYDNSDKVLLSKRVQFFVLNYKDANTITFKIKDTGGTADITLKGMATDNYTVKRDGIPYTNFIKSGSDLTITTALSEHDFEITGSNIVPTPIPVSTPTPTPTPTSSPAPSLTPAPVLSLTPTPTFTPTSTPTPTPVSTPILTLTLTPSPAPVSPGGGGGSQSTPVPTPTPTLPPSSGTSSYPDSTLLKTPDSFKVYVIINQKKKWISTPEVFETLGYQWTSITTIDSSTLKYIPDYEDNLIRAINDYKVYIVINGIKRHIPNPEIFLNYGFSWDDVKDVPQATIDKYTRGYLVRESRQGTIYYLSPAGIKKHIPSPEIFSSYNDKWEDIQVISGKEMESYPASNLVRYNNQIYLIEGTARRLIPTEAILKRYNASLIMDINKTEFDWYRKGSDVR